MSRHDDDPDRPADAAEQLRAESFGRLVDGVLGGDVAPPAIESEQRAMLDLAAQVVASSKVIELPEKRVRSIVDGALERAVLGRRAADLDPGSSATWPPARRRRERLTRGLPWVVASVAAAAAIVLFVTRPAAPPRDGAVASAPRLEQRSRPSDPLIGRIRRAEVAGASARLDTIWNDRMAGYRSLRLAGGSR
jgi:hypothetical protein